MSTTTVLVYLRQTKNSLIGNRSAKLELHKEGLLDNVIRYVNTSSLMEATETSFSEETTSQIRIEAANVIVSLAHGPRKTVQGLLTAGVPGALLNALAELRSHDSENLKVAIARALRAVCVAIAENVGTPLWGMDDDENLEIQAEAKSTLNYLFQASALDVYLPFLAESSTRIRVLIAELLAFGVRVQRHRMAVTDWMPQEERLKANKVKRGWEMAALIDANSPGRQGGWVIRHLTAMLKSNEVRTQEAALWAIAALVKDSPEIALVLNKSASESQAQTISSQIWSYSKARNSEVRLAACRCATNILRATTANRQLSVSLLHVLSSIISNNAESDSNRTKACFILGDLAMDDHDRCLDAWKSGSLIKVCDLIKYTVPTKRPQEWDDGEASSIILLREAALRALASLTLLDNDIRNEVTDNLQMLPRISVSLFHPHVGTRFASCECARSLSRAVRVLRTNILDSELSAFLCKIVKDKSEDRRVMNAALRTLCNLTTNFSPLRANILNDGMLVRIAELCGSPESQLRKSALWTVKNLLNKSSTEEKRTTMAHVGWENLLSYLNDPRDDIREQALNILCNIASNEDGIELVFGQYEKEVIMRVLGDALDSESDDVVLHAINTLANIANGRTSDQECIVSNRRLLECIRSSMTHLKKDVRLAAVLCVERLTHLGSTRELRDAKIDVTLKHIVKDHGHGGSAFSPSSLSSPSSGVEVSSEVRDKAKAALAKMFGHPDEFSM